MDSRIVLTCDGQTKLVMPRHFGSDGKPTCFLDCLRVTVKRQSLRLRSTTCDTDAAHVSALSPILKSIFGFGITKNLHRGRDFYDSSYLIGDDFGLVGIGGNHGSILIVLHGIGCAAAVEGWETRMHDWLASCVDPTITRIDIAYDDIEGTLLPPRLAASLRETGGFSLTNKLPKAEKAGDWDHPDGSGITFYIGRRQSGKYCRIYEKGRQLGDSTSDWVRIEVEYKNRDRVIPLEVLLDPTGYWLASYPCFLSIFGGVFDCESKKIATTKKTSQISLDRALRETGRCYGKYLNVFRGLYGDKRTLDLLSNPDWPRRLPKLDHRFKDAGFDRVKWLQSQLSDLPDDAAAGEQ